MTSFEFHEKKTQFSLLFTHFNENIDDDDDDGKKERRRKNQITRKNVIKILLFSHCDLFSLIPVNSFIFNISRKIYIKKIENIFQNKCVIEILLQYFLVVDRINLKIFQYIQS